MSKDFIVTVVNPQRHLEWLEVFGTTQVNVKSYRPEFATLAGDDEPQLVYYVDLDCLTHYQQQRLIRHLSNKLSLSPEQIEQYLQEQDIPIPATDCTLMVKNPCKWLG